MPSERDKTRRWWQFTIRELLLITAIIALATGWRLSEKRHSDEADFVRSSNLEQRAKLVADRFGSTEKQRRDLERHILAVAQYVRIYEEIKRLNRESVKLTDP